MNAFRLFLHVLAASIWVGGQLVLAGLVPTVRRFGEDATRQVARAFNRIAWPAYGVAVVTQILIFPVFGLHTTLAQNLKMGAIFTIVSIARSFALRRVFEAIRMRSAQ